MLLPLRFLKLLSCLGFDVYISKITIGDINDDYLREIFEKLSEKELVAIQRVNQSWQQLSERVIAGRSEVVIYDMVGDNYEAGGSGEEKKLHKFDENPAMVKALKRYLDMFRKVEGITFAESWCTNYQVNPKMLAFLFQCLPKLKSLNLKHSELWMDNVTNDQFPEVADQWRDEFKELEGLG